MKNKIKFLILIQFLFIKILSYGNEMFSWDFSDSEIKEVLYAISLDSGISITADDTVTGKCDFRFSGNDFTKAFESLLNSTRLFADKSDDLWTVSRIHIEKAKNGIIADCANVRPSVFLEKASKKLGINITYDSLPTNELSFHLETESESVFLEKLIQFFPGWELKSEGKNYHISKTSIAKNSMKGDFSIKSLANDQISIEIRNALFKEVVEKLFEQNNLSFCLLGNGDVPAVRSVFNAENFDKALKIVCAQNGFDFHNIEGIYYINGNPDTKKELIEGPDQWQFFPLRYVTSSAVLPVLAKRFSNKEINESGDGTGIWMNIPLSEKEEVLSYIKQIDVETKSYLIQLKNIKSADLISRLPAHISRDKVRDADGNCCLYWTGTKDSYEKFLSEIEVYDKAPVRLKYDLLILQYDESSENLWNSSIKARPLQHNDISSFGVNLGSVMGFNMNVPLAFGLDFATALQASINENKTKVFADTSLFGMAGKEINFSNTNTYRYRDNNLDPETGKPVWTGITREIISGLKIDVLGWVGEDGLITSSVQASITRRGMDSSSITGNPPPTTEKIVTTEVSGRSGEPVVLSGLISESDENEISRAPIISKIPLLGKLFQNETKRKEKSQMMIILVPSIDGEKKPVNKEKKYDKEWAKKRMEGLCQIINSI